MYLDGKQLKEHVKAARAVFMWNHDLGKYRKTTKLSAMRWFHRQKKTEVYQVLIDQKSKIVWIE